MKQPYLRLNHHPSGVKTFYMYKSWNGKPVRVTIGRYPGYTPEAARKICGTHLASLALGVDPREEKRKAKQEAAVDKSKLLTVDDVFQEYLKRPLSESSVRLYKQTMKKTLASIRDIPMSSITVAQVRTLIMDMESISTRNNSLTLLVSLWNFGNLCFRPDGKVIFPENIPRTASLLYKLKTPLKRRTRRLNKDQFNTFWAATSVMTVTTCVFIRTLLLTGCRRGEWARLTWSMVDWEKSIITIPKRFTKNKSRPRAGDKIVYMTDTLKAEFMLLQGMREGSVFPGFISPKGLPKNLPKMPFDVTPHDLRRTFLSVGESVGIPHVQLKILAGHLATDITEGYIQPSEEDLRHSIAMIHRYMMEAIWGLTNIVEFPVDKQA